MRHLKKFLVFILILALVMLPVTPAKASLQFEDLNIDGYTVIIHTNDTHSRAIPDRAQGQMGFTAVSALKKFCENHGAEVILLDAGDTLHGLPFANLVKGDRIVNIMNLIRYDAMTPGNHDFNYGADTLKALSMMMDFPLLSANIKLKNENTEFFKDHIVIVKNGIKFGIFGLSTPETSYKTNPKNVENIVFHNPISAAKEEVAELKAIGADFIIALAHLGVDEGSEYTSKLIAKEVEGIDLIVDGHSHTVFEEGFQVKDTLIVSTGEYIQNIGVVAINPEGKIAGAGLVNQTIFTETDPAIDALIASYNKMQEELLTEVVGSTKVELDGIREHVRTKETNLGNLAADAFRWKTGGDLAFTNGGGIRASINVGDITKQEIVTSFPFGNYIVTKKVTGEALLMALEHGVRIYPEPNGGFLQVSGITFTMDPKKPAGSRIVEAKVNGKALNPDAEYLLATNDFLVIGGDGYTMLTDFPTVNEFGSMEEIIIEYLQHIGEVKINNENRISILNPEELADGFTKEAEDERAGEKETTYPNFEGMSKNQDGYYIYIIKEGDYLRKIAVNLFGVESDWKLIYKWNKDIIKHPDLIYTGVGLKIYPDRDK
ncbi:MAG: multifunctional 2',3'-cyclic-nucleotide 2'-phosphodiesterase/5'-nucleotidase/3'-nucleotidase [Clostridiales bacterium]|jgi:5'-nucleotidase/UDP-sugar diphosphatase|nr:multifunctional 2',3'-cyclic-nucleotide 2'-phosphodiesterase/5'-nucleotidase/3'-nucleotidase [Clostridiales bacterium]